MHRELGTSFVGAYAAGRQFDDEVFKIVAFTGINLHGFGDDLVALNIECASVGQRHAVDVDAGTMGVGRLVEFQFERDGSVDAEAGGGFRFVVKVEGEHGGTVSGHIAAFVYVDVHFRVLQSQGSCRDGHFGAVEFCAVGHLAGTPAGSAAQVVDQRTIEIVVAVVVVSFAHEVACCFRILVECKLTGTLFQPVDAEVHIAVEVGREGVAYGAAVGGALLWVAAEVDVNDGFKTELCCAPGGVQCHIKRIRRPVLYGVERLGDEVAYALAKGTHQTRKIA